jgi:prophage regulatory protein
MDTITENRIICATERRELIPYSDMHIWRMERDGRFPLRIKLGPNRVGWSLQEIVEWVDLRKAERGTGGANDRV